MKQSRILNIDILSITKNHLLANLTEGVLFTPNVDHLINLQKDKDFFLAYQQADFIICDSQIIRFASRLLKRPIVETIPGSDFLSYFYFYHKDNPDITLFLLGAKEGIAAKAMQNINEKVGHKIVTGTYSPPFGFETNESECEAIIQMINENRATVLVVGLGSPKQEKWIARYKDRLPHVKIFMGLGATIDFEAGVIPRSPHFFRKIGMEWAYRLCTDPKRLWKRYLINDIPFFHLIVKDKTGKYKNPFA